MAMMNRDQYQRDMIEHIAACRVALEATSEPIRAFIRKRFDVSLYPLEFVTDLIAELEALVWAWQPIETGLERERRVLVIQPSGCISFGCFVESDDDVFTWVDDDTGEALRPQPTHWMPLPGKPGLGAR